MPSSEGTQRPTFSYNAGISGSIATSNSRGAQPPALFPESLSSPGLRLTPTALRRKPTPKPGQGVWAEDETPPPGVPDLCPRPGLRASLGGHRRAGGCRCLLCVSRCKSTPQPSAASPRGPRRLLSASPAPLLGSACQLGARWFAPRGARRRGEGPQPPPPRAAPEPSRAGGTRRRRSCGPDCSSGPPASRSCCRASRPAAIPGGRRRGTSGPRGKRPATLPCASAGALPARSREARRGVPESRVRADPPLPVALSARASPGGRDKGTTACGPGGWPSCAPGRGCPDWDLAGGPKIPTLGEPL